MKKKVKGEGWLKGCHDIMNDKANVIKWKLALSLVVSKSANWQLS